MNPDELREALDRIPPNKNELEARKHRTGPKAGPGITQQELAKRLGYTPESVNNWLQGRNAPKQAVVMHIQMWAGESEGSP
jgi:DNA-binding transcriptional regulator YiaG